MFTQKLTLGNFISGNDGAFHGSINALGMGSTSVMTQDTKDREGKRYLRFIADPLGAAYEIGVGFPKEKDGKTYYSVTIDSPFLPAPIKAALFQDFVNETVFNLVWNRADIPKVEVKHIVEQQPHRRHASPSATP